MRQSRTIAVVASLFSSEEQRGSVQRPIRLSISAVAMTVLLTGCATTTRLYEGPTRSAASVGVVTDPSLPFQLLSTINISAVDGKRFDSLLGKFKIEVPPGHHTFTYGFGEAGGPVEAASRAQLTVGFDVQAGHHYVLDYNKITSDRWIPVVRDKTAKTAVTVEVR